MPRRPQCQGQIITVHRRTSSTSCNINNNISSRRNQRMLYRHESQSCNDYDGWRRIYSRRRRRAGTINATTCNVSIMAFMLSLMTMTGHHNAEYSETSSSSLLLFVSSAMLLRSPPTRPRTSFSPGRFVPSFVPETGINLAAATSTTTRNGHYYCHNNNNYVHGNNYCRIESTKLYMVDPSPAGKYLNRLSENSNNNAARNTTSDANNGGDNTNSVNGDQQVAAAAAAAVVVPPPYYDDDEVEYEDDDYAMSIPMPVQSTEPERDDTTSSSSDDKTNIIDDDDNAKSANKDDTPADASSSGKSSASSAVGIKGDDNGILDNEAHPNEELPEGGDDVYDELAAFVEAGKTSKFETLEKALYEEVVVVVGGAASKNKNNNNDESAAATTTTTTKSSNSGIKTLFQNLMGDNSDAKRKEETERARKWRQWMTTGRKVRADDSDDGSSNAESSEIAIDGSLLSLDKGADYVVVAVPAEAADGIGPILSSFPGGKSFQKTVQKTYQEVIRKKDNDRATSSSSSSAANNNNAAAAASHEKKKKKETEKKKKQTAEDAKKKLQRQKQDEQKQRRELRRESEQRIREPGRVSASDWRRNIHNLPSSTILRDVRNPVACVFAWATVWSVVHRSLTEVAAGSGVVGLGRLFAGGSSTVTLSPRWVGAAGWFARHMSLPTVQHSMMVSAMSLLLVFRTNSAYQRFAEGRKIWNDIVDTTRDFSRMLKLYEFAIGTSKCRRINSLLASFPYLLRHRIRPSLMNFYRVNDLNVERNPENSLLLYPDESLRDTDPDVAALAYDEGEMGSGRTKTRELCWVDRRTLPWKLIPGTALELCARAQNRPLWVCDRMAKELAVVEDMTPTFTNRERLALIGYVDKLSRSIGACERIHQTVVPLNYARHALRSLTVWLWTLPFVLVKDLGLLTGPVVAILSWILFGVYEIGSKIEDPFQGTLRLSIYCDAIRRDVLADAIARDTAFILEEDSYKSSTDKDDEYDAIFEMESESEEYEGEASLKKKKKKQNTGDFLESWGFK